MKSMNEEMDILDEDWELLPDEGFLEIQNDAGKSIFSRKYSSNKSTTTDFQMNYFICPTPKSTLQFIEKTGPVSVPSAPKDEEELVKKQEFEKNPTQIKIKPQIDQDPVSQVFFKKMKENEFVDMKLDSPKSNSSSNINNNKGIEVGFQFEKKGEQQGQPGGDDDSDMVMMKKNYESDDDGVGLNLWKWSLNGIGAICSFGMAAATTVCIIILSSSSHGSKSKHHPHHNQKQLQFQIFTNEKEIKQVIHHAGKISEAISAVRGVPVSRANITFGGYYDAAM